MNLKFVLCLLCVNSVFSWKWAGHYLTTRIAQILLEKDSPETVENINHILQILELSSPSQTVYEGKHPFVECSAYADWIKYRGGSWQSNWHFVDVPILDQGGGIRNFTVPDHNSSTIQQKRFRQSLTGLTTLRVTRKVRFTSQLWKMDLMDIHILIHFQLG